MLGTILQINVSRGGIPKRPIDEGFLSPLGIEGDMHAHPEIHGGPKQAVLLICSEAIEELTAKGYPVFPGALGENMTIRGIDRSQLRSGQRFHVGQAIIELTKVRGPCTTLDGYGPSIKAEIYDREVNLGDTASPKWAMSGFYAAVVQPGVVRRDDIIALIDQVV